MLYSSLQLREMYSDYSQPQAKIARGVSDGSLTRITRDVYSDAGQEENRYAIANRIIRPSYVSFWFALAHYGLIPERVYEVTSATTGIRKRKQFQSSLGVFSYQDIPQAAFPYGIITKEDGTQIASKEKAFCDTLYLLPPVRSLKALKALLFEDLRIDEAELRAMDREDLRFLLPLYGSTNSRWMIRLLEDKEWKIG